MTPGYVWVRLRLVLCIFVWCGVTHAQDRFPARPVAFILPWGVGGGADQLARLVGRKLESDLLVPFPVIPRPGASGTRGIRLLLDAPADGYAIAVLTGDTLSAVANDIGNWKLDELTALGVFVRQSSGLFVRADSQYKTWNDVLRAEKANPGKLNVATAGPGSMDAMTIAYLNSKGVNLESVAYGIPGQRYAEVIGGHVDFLYEQAGDIKGHLDGKVLRPVLLFTSKRTAPFLDIAVSGEFGYELALTQFRAVVARKGIAPVRLGALAITMERYARSEEFIAYLREQLAAPDSYIPAAQAQAFLRSEFEAMRRFAAGVAKPAR